MHKIYFSVIGYSAVVIVILAGLIGLSGALQKMGCKRQEAKRLGTGLQNRNSGFDSRLAVHFFSKICGKKTTAGERFWSLGQSSQNPQFMTISGNQSDTWISDCNPKRSYVVHPYAYLPQPRDSVFYALPFALSYRSCPIQFNFLNLDYIV